MRLRVDDLDRGTQHGVVVPLEEGVERVSAILQPQGPQAAPERARTAPTMVTSPPTTEAAVRRALRAVDKAPQEELPGVARNLTLAAPMVWPELLESLQSKPEHSKRDYKAVLDVIGGDALSSCSRAPSGALRHPSGNFASQLK